MLSQLSTDSDLTSPSLSHVVKIRDQADFMTDRSTLEPILEYWREAGVTDIRRPPLRIGGPKSTVYLVEVFSQNPHLTTRDFEAPGNMKFKRKK